MSKNIPIPKKFTEGFRVFLKILSFLILGSNILFFLFVAIFSKGLLPVLHHHWDLLIILFLPLAALGPSPNLDYLHFFPIYKPIVNGTLILIADVILAYEIIRSVKLQKSNITRTYGPFFIALGTICLFLHLNLNAEISKRMKLTKETQEASESSKRKTQLRFDEISKNPIFITDFETSPNFIHCTIAIKSSETFALIEPINILNCDNFSWVIDHAIHAGKKVKYILPTLETFEERYLFIKKSDKEEIVKKEAHTTDVNMLDLNQERITGFITIDSETVTEEFTDSYYKKFNP